MNQVQFRGNDRILVGFILGLLAFWLFAQTMLNINVVMGEDLGIAPNIMNLAVAAAALFSGLFIVVFGALADRYGRVLILRVGFLLSVIGSLLVALTPKGSLAPIFLIGGRILQGLSIACIMPSSLALLKVYWEGAARQRAISLWSMGTWGGSGFCSLVGGLLVASIGWRSIFLFSAVSSVIGFFLIKGLPESRAEAAHEAKTDWAGLLLFIVGIFSLQLIATQGSSWGWADWKTLSLIALVVVVGILFFMVERRKDHAFINLSLFRNLTFTGATVSNFVLNAVAGILIVSLNLLQLAGGLSPAKAGYLTLGYAILVVSFIRFGERLLRMFGPRKPMIWGSLIVALAIILLMFTNVMTSTYMILAAIAYSLFGVGLAFYATPSTDAALGNLPEEEAGAGSGIYKMASSLGAAFGVAISTTIFTSLNLRASPSSILDTVIDYVGRQDNVIIRESAMLALLFNLILVLMAIVVIMRTIPKGKPAKQG